MLIYTHTHTYTCKLLVCRFPIFFITFLGKYLCDNLFHIMFENTFIIRYMYHFKIILWYNVNEFLYCNTIVSWWNNKTYNYIFFVNFFFKYLVYFYKELLSRITCGFSCKFELWRHCWGPSLSANSQLRAQKTFFWARSSVQLIYFQSHERSIGLLQKQNNALISETSGDNEILFLSLSFFILYGIILLKLWQKKIWHELWLAQ